MYYNIDETKVLKNLKSKEKGLTNSEAEKRLLKYGKNAIKEPEKTSLLKLFFAQMKDLMIVVLLCAAAISAIIAIIEKNYIDLIDSGIILFTVIVNSIIGVVQQGKADKSMEMLKNMNRPYTKVMRDGEIVSIKSENLTIGDIVVLEAGDRVPADLRIISSHSLKFDESTLTGESVPVEKDAKVVLNINTPLADRKNMAFSSTVVSYGRGTGVVVAIGENTEVGKIAEMLYESNKNELTPLQSQLNKTAKLLSIVVLLITVVIFITYIIKNGFILDNIVHGFMTAIAIAVAAIPEGLAAVVTIVLAIGVKEMSKRNAIVKKLPAVETLGCCQIICSDKTGTLTLNQMTVKSLFTMAHKTFVDISKVRGKDVEYLLNGMLLCNDVKENSGTGFVGDPTEIALTQYAKDLEINYLDILANNERVDEYPFDSQRKMMTTVNKCGKVLTAYTKGALDKMLVRCDKIIVGDKVRKITAADKKTILNANMKMSDSALRVLGIAVSSDTKKANIENNLTFVGLVGMIDPPRPEVKAAVETCEKAGMKAIMITGDHLNTAVAIAKEIGIYKDGCLAITGEELDNLSDEEFYKNIDKYAVFARVSPENKVRIVKAFKHFEYIVAMTGDGVNDAPSIKAADVGVGMGITGTDVSKEASDIVLTDDNFATIVGAVKEGRKVYSNIQNVIKYLLSANIAEVMCLLIATLFLLSPGTEFLTPVMILWINLVTDSFPALALAYEKADRDIMYKKPRKNNNSLFSGRTGKDIIIEGVMQTGLTMLSYCLGNYVIGDHLIGMAMAFVTLCIIQLLHAYNCKSNKSIFRKNPLDNKVLNLAFVTSALLVLIPTTIPTLAMFFGMTSLTLNQWLIALACAVAIIPMVEIYKLITKKQ